MPLPRSFLYVPANRDKFLELASPVLGEATARALVAKLWKLETLPDVTTSLA